MVLFVFQKVVTNDNFFYNKDREVNTMLEIPIPADVQSYQSKAIFGFSVRQFLSIIGAIAVVIPFAIIGKKFLSEDALIWSIIIIGAAFYALGFFKASDMQFEEFAKHWLSYFLLPQERYYENAETDELDEILTTIVENTLNSETEGDEI